MCLHFYYHTLVVNWLFRNRSFSEILISRFGCWPRQSDCFCSSSDHLILIRIVPFWLKSHCVRFTFFVLLCELIRTALFLRGLRHASTSLIVKSSVVNRYVINCDVHYISACFYNFKEEKLIHIKSFGRLFYAVSFVEGILSCLNRPVKSLFVNQVQSVSRFEFLLSWKNFCLKTYALWTCDLTDII